MLNIRTCQPLLVFCVLASGLCVSPILAQSPPKIAYDLQLLPGPVIQVTVTMKTGDQSSTELGVIKEWGGIVNDGTDVSDLKIWDTDGNHLQVTALSATDWKVDHLTNSTLTVRYNVLPKGNREVIRGSDYRTRMDTSLFQMISRFGLLSPIKGEEKDEAVALYRISFSGFREQGWQVMSSFGEGEGTFDYSGTMSEFLHSVVIAGRFQSLVREISGNRVGIAVVGESWQFTANELADLVSSVVQAERDFFDDHSDAWYLITLTPLPQTSPRETSLGGTALTNAYCLYCTNNFTLSTDSDQPMKAVFLLAHEYFHQWNGNKIPSAGEDPDTYWFSEGFTNYFTRKILLRSGIISKEQYIADLNQALQAYDANPLRLAANSEIQSGFWSNYDAERLPYQRGDMLAVMLDEQIQIRSQGRQSLDDVMLDMLRNPLKDKPTTSKSLFRRLKAYVDPDTMSRVEASILAGADVVMPESLAELKLKLAKASMQSLDPGFDVEKSREAKKAVDVIVSGNAYQAGLRDGHEIRRFSIDSSLSPPIAELTFIDNGVEKQVKYEALGAPYEIRIYSPN